MDIVFALLALIFGGLFILRQFQYQKLKHFTSHLEKELVEIKDRQTQLSSEVAKSNQELAFKPVDHLTGLPGREAFDDRLTQAMYQSKRYQTSMALLALNVDNLKLINSLSYEIGDELIKQLGRRLLSCIRQVDTLTRYAGNTFYILLPQIVKPETAAYVAQRVQDILIQPFKIENREIYITVSTGIAIYPMDGDDIQSFMKSANKALELAKMKGKNTYQFFRQEIQESGEKEVAIASFVRSGDFFTKLLIEYHPQVLVEENTTLHIAGIPYILHPKYGKVLYNDFLAIAENARKNIDIIKWLLTKSFDQVNEWYSESIKPRALVIKVAAKQLENLELISYIIQVVHEKNKYNLDIIFEIIDDHSQLGRGLAIENFSSILKDEKFKVAIDVYTFGQFTLQKTNKFPINFLIIDVNLLNKHESLLKGIMLSIQNSEIQLIAQNVDNENQKNLLIKMGCHIMQGKLFDSLLPSNNLIGTVNF